MSRSAVNPAGLRRLSSSSPSGCKGGSFNADVVRCGGGGGSGWWWCLVEGGVRGSVEEERGGDKLLFSQGKAHRAPKLRRNTDAIFRKRGRLWSSSGTRTSQTHTHTCAHVRTCTCTCTMRLYCIFTFANQPQLRCS